MERRKWLLAFPAALGVMLLRKAKITEDDQLIHKSIAIVHRDGTTYYPLVAKKIENQDVIGNKTTITINALHESESEEPNLIIHPH